MSRYIGLMSGTSMDAVDAALADFDSGQGQVLEFVQLPIPDDLRQALAPTRQPEARFSLQEIGQLDVRVGRLFAKAAQNAIARVGLDPKEVTAIGSHGQTIWHQPSSPDPFTFQIGDPNTIATLTGITTVADFRGMDVAAGGRGAPPS